MIVHLFFGYAVEQWSFHESDQNMKMIYSVHVLNENCNSNQSESANNQLCSAVFQYAVHFVTRNPTDPPPQLIKNNYHKFS